MELSSNLHIKGYSMIIGKCFFILLLIITINCRKMDNQNFKLFGNEELLTNSKINIVKIDESGNKNVQTLLFLGKQKNVIVETEVGVVYNVYVSYNDSVFNVLKFENVMRNANDHINHLYMTKENNSIYINYVGREAEIENKKGFGVFLLPKAEYFKLNNIENDDEKKKQNELFSSEY